jgi:hypothetical protein
MARFAAAVPATLKRAVVPIFRKVIKRLPSVAGRADLSVDPIFYHDSHFFPLNSI